jgi:hypothetical protein
VTRQAVAERHVDSNELQPRQPACFFGCEESPESAPVRGRIWIDARDDAVWRRARRMRGTVSGKYVGGHAHVVVEYQDHAPVRGVDPKIARGGSTAIRCVTQHPQRQSADGRRRRIQCGCGAIVDKHHLRAAGRDAGLRQRRERGGQSSVAAMAGNDDR